ncbi:MAG: Uma2 family endonuclease [Deltaproteobacteria bacterium]|nr:Uma2 family endonuclease [Deltaproteobacteria bacterium]
MHVAKQVPDEARLPPLHAVDDVEYPDSDGQPMADNTKQFDLIVLIKLNIDDAIPDFVGGNILWYPEKGNPKVRAAPDVLIAIGRPKGDRGSYKQWEEEGVAPQVVFEVLSPGNRFPDMVEKHLFYEKFGVEEYYVIDPDSEQAFGFVRENERLVALPSLDGFVSRRVGIRFELGPKLVIRHRDGSAFTSRSEERQRADRAEQQRAEAEQQRAEAERRAQALIDQLRALGVDPTP